MSRPLIASLTVVAMLAFAGNSLLCRVALRDTGIDPASFTSIRLASGAIALWLIMYLRTGSGASAGSWWSAWALFAYAAAFSYAYLSLSAATGALLLFGAVQATMIGHGLWQGHRLSPRQWLGLVLALGGLVGLLLPGLSAPPLLGSMLMLGAGAAWGVYSLRGKRGGDPTAVTAGNFMRGVPMALGLSLLAVPTLSIDAMGLGYAIASGALASGVGYAIWYMALPGLRPASAASVQLSVPVIAALGGVLFLDELPTLRLFIAALAILGGIALVILSRGMGERRP